MYNQILQFLRKNINKSFKFNLIIKKLGLPQNSRQELRKTLNDLLVDGKITKSGKWYSIKNTHNIYTGEISIDKYKKFIVKYIDQNETEKFITVKQKKDINYSIGDKIEFLIYEGNKKEEEYAKPLKVIYREKVIITGRFEKNKYLGYVVPDSRKIKKDIYIPKNYYHGADVGDKVVCEIINYDEIDTGQELEGMITEVLGESGVPEVEFAALIKKYGLNNKFPEKVLNLADKIFKEENLISNQLISERIDLRDKICFTIDPDDAKDFDDAVSIEKTESGGYLLGVHIADVSHFVTENSEIDIEALNRGTSVYILNGVVPMLPEVLSNDMCSLKEGLDRLTFSVFIELDNKCKLKKYDISKSIINSKKRFSYEESQKIIDKRKGLFKDELLLMNRVAKNLHKDRLKAGSIDFETREVKIMMDENGKVIDIVAKERLETMKLIEEYMLLANKCVTEFVIKLAKEFRKEYPFIYRVHDLPDSEKLRALSEFVTQFGYKLNVKDKNSIKNLLEEIKNKPEEYLINDLLIRSMAKAVYTEKNIGHYGLGFENYTHFTSPIRRYPDLIVHRILFDYLAFTEKKEIEEHIPHQFHRLKYYRKVLPEICKICSAKEQNAVSAERESIKIKQIEYLSSRIGYKYDGIISGIVGYGMFVEILDLLIEGMVRFRDIEDDYYEFDERKHCAIGIRRGKVYRSGQKVIIEVTNVDIQTRKIDFILV